MMLVKVDNLKKSFGKTLALDGISFELSSGQVVGFVGPNGAGKTTTMRIMATIDDPDHGDVFFDGVSLMQYPENVRKMVGFMPDFLPTHRDMTVHDYIDFFARAFAITGEKRRSVVERVEEFANLTGIRDKFLNALSKGMKQRVSLARAIVHDPAVLILDEPASGLDPRARIELRELLKALAEQGKAIFVSSHILSELAEVCDSAVIIEKGKILTAGLIKDLTGSRPHRTVIIRAAGKCSDLHKRLLEMPKVVSARVHSAAVEVDIQGTEDDTAEIVAALIKDNFKVIEVRHIQAGLEEVFMDITKGDIA